MGNLHWALIILKFLFGSASPGVPIACAFTRVRQVRHGDAATKKNFRSAFAEQEQFFIFVGWFGGYNPLSYTLQDLTQKENNVIIKALAAKLLPQNNLMLTKLYNYASS